MMGSPKNLYCDYTPTKKSILLKTPQKITLKFSINNERKVLKAILLGNLYYLFHDHFYKTIHFSENNNLMECYIMDNKIIQLLIHGIVETGEYTLEGIALYTRIPFDVIYDAACGVSNQLSITPWAKIVDLYLQVKPDIREVLINRFLEIKNKNQNGLSALLNEE